MKVLLLEDDNLFSQTIEDFLDDEGFIVDIAIDGEEALALNYKNNYDLYLLDINVPKINGLELLKDLRQSGDETPAIYLTSRKDSESLKEGFLNGADDYLKKPVDLDELLLRINSLMKRYGKKLDLVHLDDKYSYDPLKKRVYVNGKDINLAVKIIDLLDLFLQYKNEIVTKEMIIQRLWSIDDEYSEGSIRVYINHIKKILGKDNIINIKGVGYKFEQ